MHRSCSHLVNLPGNAKIPREVDGSPIGNRRFSKTFYRRFIIQTLTIAQYLYELIKITSASTSTSFSDAPRPSRRCDDDDCDGALLFRHYGLANEHALALLNGGDDKISSVQ